MKGDLIRFAPILDATANDSNKDITIPNGGNHDVELLWLHVALTTTATANNRLLELEVRDPDGNSCGHVHPGSYQAPSLTYHYYFLPGIFRETVSAVAETGVDGTIQVPMPMQFVVPKGFSLNIRDVEAVDAAADDMILRGMFKVTR